MLRTLLAVEHDACMGSVRMLEASVRFAEVDTVCGDDLDCFARELLRRCPRVQRTCEPDGDGSRLHS